MANFPIEMSNLVTNIHFVILPIANTDIFDRYSRYTGSRYTDSRYTDSQYDYRHNTKQDQNYISLNSTVYSPYNFGPQWYVPALR